MPILFLVILLQLTTLTPFIQAGWAPTTAPKWYKNYPPWWISKVDDKGYKDNMPVSVLPMQPIRAAPKVGGNTLPKKMIEQIEKGYKKHLNFPSGSESSVKLFDDSNGNKPGSSMQEQDGGALYDTIMHANDHSETRKGGKKSAHLAILEDPVFKNQAPDISPTKEFLLIELEQHQHQRQRQRQHQLLRGREGAAAPASPDSLAGPNAYDIGPSNQWVTTNNDKEMALKKRVGQSLPLWDPYWQKHPNQMPSFQSGTIANNAFLHYKNSPFDLLRKNQFGGASGPSQEDGTKEDGGAEQKKPALTASSFEDDSSW